MSYSDSGKLFIRTAVTAAADHVYTSTRITAAKHVASAYFATLCGLRLAHIKACCGPDADAGRSAVQRCTAQSHAKAKRLAVAPSTPVSTNMISMVV
jgi:hypothetical protein